MKYLLLLLSLTSGLAVWVGLTKYEASLERKFLSQQSTDQHVDVLVYSENADFGETISESMIISQRRLLSSLPDEYISITGKDSTQLYAKFVGKKLAKNVRKYDLLNERDFTLEAARALSALLDVNGRAASIKVSAEKIAGGFVLPGDRIDLIATLSKAFNEGERPTTRSFTFIKNAKVLAVGQDASTARGLGGSSILPVASNGKSVETILGKTLTLELNQDQVEVLNAAQQIAKLSVSLRRPSKNTDTIFGDTSFLDRESPLEIQAKTENKKSDVQGVTNSVELVVINGQQVKSYTFKK